MKRDKNGKRMKNSAFCDVAFLKSSQLNGFASLFNIERQKVGIKMKNARAGTQKVQE